MVLKESPVQVADLAALGKMFEEHRARLLRVVRQRMDPALAARSDPEEILAQAFLKARGRYSQFQQSGMTAYAWLYRLVIDCLYDAHDFNTRQRRNLHREVPWPDDASSQCLLGSAGRQTSPSEALAREEVRERVRQALAALKPEDREVLCMRFFDQLSNEEIASILGIAGGTVRIRYVRALRRFQQLWNRLYGGRPAPGDSNP